MACRGWPVSRQSRRLWRHNSLFQRGWFASVRACTTQRLTRSSSSCRCVVQSAEHSGGAPGATCGQNALFVGVHADSPEARARHVIPRTYIRMCRLLVLHRSCVRGQTSLNCGDSRKRRVAGCPRYACSALAVRRRMNLMKHTKVHLAKKANREQVRTLTNSFL